MGRLSELFANPEQGTKRGRLAELLYQRSMAEPAPVPDVRTNAPQVMGGLLGMIDSAKRRVGKNLSDLVNNPDQYLRLIAERLPETAQNMASDPGNFIPGGGMAGTFIGKSAKTWDALKEAEAMKRLAAGENPAQVWKETGIAVAPWDKAARGEIPDNITPTKMDATVENFMFTPIVNEYMTHDPLFKAYPTTQMIQMQRGKVGNGLGGSFNEATNKIDVDVPYFNGKSIETNRNATSTTMHELQHAIQHREGWARGGSPENAPIVNEELLAGVRAQKKELGIDPYAIQNRIAARYPVADADIQKLKRYQELNSVEDEILANRLEPYEAYKRLAGEAEARLTQARIPMTMEDRLAQYPYDPAYFEKATGVKLSDLITRMK